MAKLCCYYRKWYKKRYECILRGHLWESFTNMTICNHCNKKVARTALGKALIYLKTGKHKKSYYDI